MSGRKMLGKKAESTKRVRATRGPFGCLDSVPGPPDVGTAGADAVEAVLCRAVLCCAWSGAERLPTG